MDRRRASRGHVRTTVIQPSRSTSFLGPLQCNCRARRQRVGPGGPHLDLTASSRASTSDDDASRCVTNVTAGGGHSPSDDTTPGTREEVLQPALPTKAPCVGQCRSDAGKVACLPPAAYAVRPGHTMCTWFTHRRSGSRPGDRRDRGLRRSTPTTAAGNRRENKERPDGLAELARRLDQKWDVGAVDRSCRRRGSFHHLAVEEPRRGAATLTRDRTVERFLG